MTLTKTGLEGCFIIEPWVFYDERGLFFESYQKEKLEKAMGFRVNFVQDNQSTSNRGVLRGLHFQKGEDAQAKLVHVVKGEVLDVIVDLRKNSRSFGQHIKIVLSDEDQKSIFIPKGMAHGFLVRGEEAIFAYKCDAYYKREAESGIVYNDPTLGIDWGIPEAEVVLSEKDAALPLFKTLYP